MLCLKKIPSYGTTIVWQKYPGNSLQNKIKLVKTFVEMSQNRKRRKNKVWKIGQVSFLGRIKEKKPNNGNCYYGVQLFQSLINVPLRKDFKTGLMPCPFTGPKMFCAGPNFLSQPKKFDCIYCLFKNFCAGTKNNFTGTICK